jgi:hypothetical protein
MPRLVPDRFLKTHFRASSAAVRLKLKPSTGNSSTATTVDLGDDVRREAVDR